MGVPAFFRWLTLRYPRIVIDAMNPKTNSSTADPNGIDLNLDTDSPNPSVDNLYLDMNGIIHPCTTGLHG